jgi:hypothetical protein
MSVRDIKGAQVSVGLHKKIEAEFKSWKDQYCRNGASDCSELNVVLDFNTFNFQLIDAR